jgi:AraC-like DNA-binding protein
VFNKLGYFMVSSAIQPETATFFRRKELPGVELRRVENSAPNWRSYSTGFEFMVPSSWHGEIWHRNQLITLRPGSVLCAQPGEVFAAQRVLAPGSGTSLLVDERVLHTHLAEYVGPLARSATAAHQLGPLARSATAAHQLGPLARSATAAPRSAPGRIKLRAYAKLSTSFAATLGCLIESLQGDGDAAELQRRMHAVIEGIVDELLDQDDAPADPLDCDTRAAQRVREWLHDDPSVSVDLETLASEIGMSRFRALRLFKRRYGLPPHTYQLHLRLGLAQKSLREGVEPAQVAAEYGFVDQSHLTRHFKRLLGVTPARYARIGSATR